MANGLAAKRRSWFGAGSRLDIIYRKLATGFCIFVFMASGLFISLCILPLLRILPFSKPRRENLRLALIHVSFKSVTKFFCLLRIMDTFQVEGLHHVSADKPVVFIANHPTLIDVVAILGVLPRCNCIVKGELFSHPFMGGVLRGTGLIPNDSGPSLLQRVESEFAKGHSLMIFPEGTRSPLGGLHKFNRGAARLLLHTGVPVVPVFVSCTPSTLLKNQPWYDTPARAVTFKLTFFPPMDPRAQVDPALPMPRQVRALNRRLQSFFEAKIAEEAETDAGTRSVQCQ